MDEALWHRLGVALGITFFRELWHLYHIVFSAGEAEVVLMVLSLVDVVLVTNLIVMEIGRAHV